MSSPSSSLLVPVDDCAVELPVDRTVGVGAALATARGAFAVSLIRTIPEPARYAIVGFVCRSQISLIFSCVRDSPSLIILPELVRRGVSFADLEVTRPSLEDTYLELVRRHEQPDGSSARAGREAVRGAPPASTSPRRR